MKILTQEEIKECLEKSSSALDSFLVAKCEGEPPRMEIAFASQLMKSILENSKPEPSGETQASFTQRAREVIGEKKEPIPLGCVAVDAAVLIMIRNALQRDWEEKGFHSRKEMLEELDKNTFII